MRAFFIITAVMFEIAGTAARADPNPNAVSEMHWAITSCKKAFEDIAAGTARDDLADWTKRRAKAVTIDASITTFKGKDLGDTVASWVAHCDKDLAAHVAKLGASDEAQDLAGNAISECHRALDDQQTDGSEQYAKYKELRDKARKLDPDVEKEKLGECDKRLPGVVAAHKKTIDTSNAAAKKQADDAVADYQRDQKAAAEQRKKILKKLKGDRYRIFDKYGEPADYDGDDLAAARANVWTYKWTSSAQDNEFECVRTFTFKGNKLVKQTKGKWCELAGMAD